MTGQTNLREVLNAMQLSCDNVEYGFATVQAGTSVDIAQVLGIFKEAEGLTVFASKDYFEGKKLAYEGPLAKLTIEVHTSLELVGLTAVLAAKLTENNIPANVVAAYYHDHVFVQYDLRDKAIDALNGLKDLQLQ